ncbi:MAG: hypothetical protein ACR2NF_13175, partial [Pirellulales bacterium]
DSGRGSRLLAFFIFKRNEPHAQLFLVFCGQVVSQTVNYGGNSDVLGGLLPAGRRGHGLVKCPR